MTEYKHYASGKTRYTLLDKQIKKRDKNKKLLK